MIVLKIKKVAGEGGGLAIRAAVEDTPVTKFRIYAKWRGGGSAPTMANLEPDNFCKKGHFLRPMPSEHPSKAKEN